MVEAVAFHHATFTLRSLSSPLYHCLLGAALDDIARGGPVAAVLTQVPDGLVPLDDAVTLRFLGGVHRLVLTGKAPELARWFPTAGGIFADDEGDRAAAAAAFLAACEQHRDELVASLDVGVQTNEMARCAALAVGFTEVLRTTGLPLRLLEVGASAGLNLRWDRWRYESGATSWGDPASAVRFADNYRLPSPDLAAPLGPGDAVASRRGCDRSPIDPTTDEGQLLLRSFVWPDQADRHVRLDAALAAAAEVPVVVDRADAASWVADQLAEPAPGTATVVYHSIVWQYLPADTKAGVAAAVEAAGATAPADAPVTWFRMEPPDDPSDAAELRLTSWPGGDRVIGRTGYHGHPVWAGASPQPG
jgi:hypothetical protein